MQGRSTHFNLSNHHQKRTKRSPTRSTENPTQNSKKVLQTTHAHDHPRSQHDAPQLHTTNWNRPNTPHQPFGKITDATATSNDGQKHKDNRALANSTKTHLHTQTNFDTTKHHWPFILHQPRQTETREPPQTQTGETPCTLETRHSLQR